MMEESTAASPVLISIRVFESAKETAQCLRMSLTLFLSEHPKDMAAFITIATEAGIVKIVMASQAF